MAHTLWWPVILITPVITCAGVVLIGGKSGQYTQIEFPQAAIRELSVLSRVLQVDYDGDAKYGVLDALRKIGLTLIRPADRSSFWW